MIETSICISRSRLQLVKNAIEKLHISESELLSILLFKSRSLFGDSAVTGRTVEYQRNTDKSEYVIHHITLKEVDYEFATGRRFLFKISVSFLFAISISVLLNEILYERTKEKCKVNQNWTKYKTNFYFQNYTVYHLDGNSSEYWLIPWPKMKE